VFAGRNVKTTRVPNTGMTLALGVLKAVEKIIAERYCH
jgi:hypothetical protein